MEKIKLNFKKERVVLSEILPYEIPLTFSNRYFYKFLESNKVRYLNQDIYLNNSDTVINKIVEIIFGTRLEPNNKIDFVTIPFTYKISHKENEFRELAICHPRNQLQIIEFYDKHKELILYYCNISSFSIRKPQRISKFIYYKDKTHFDNLSNENSILEEHSKEYENLRSFFVYKDYSNVYKFYESYKFHRCEKKYNTLLKLDISKCFDSIYTHSIAWALINKEGIKENLILSKNTFAGQFDILMQQLNYNETNGIIIGPEFSRIFAELILQSVDFTLELTLKNKYHLRNKDHYEIFRYVDDYFVFYNDDKTKENIVSSLQIHLKEYKLSLNVSKQIIYEKPIITEITIAKHRIKYLLNEKLVFTLDKIDSIYENEKKPKGSIRINANSLITQFKTIIKESNVEYRDILNYTISIIEGNSEKILKNYYLSDKKEEQLVKAILEIIEFTFFIYSVSPRVNTTIKLSRVLAIFIFFVKKELNNDFKHLVFKSIFDNICFILRKNKNTENTQVETLYLLIILSELGKEYRLDEFVLSSFFDIEKDNNEYSSSKHYNYFTLTVLIFYIKDKKRYSNLRSFIEKKIQEKFEQKAKLIWKDTELILLFLDIVVCPYVSSSLKIKLLEFYGISDINLQQTIINKKTQWFTSWNNFDFQKELDAKRSKEVY